MELNNFEINKKETLKIIEQNNERHKSELANIKIDDLPKNNFLIKCPNFASQWNYNKNGDLKPWQFTHGSNKKVWFLCSEMCQIGGCIHEYESTIHNISKGFGCGYCGGTSNVLFCYHKSLEYLYPEIAKMWHPDKNGDVNPSNVLAKSTKKVWFRCQKITCKENCYHDFEAVIGNVVLARIKNPDMTGCPYCCKTSRKVCEHLSLAFLFPEITKELYTIKNDNVDPKTVPPHSDIKLWFKCPNVFQCGCEHIYLSKINNRTRSVKPSGCPFCASKQYCIHSTLNVTHPEISSEWNYELNTLLPSNFSYGSHEIVHWKCTNDATHNYKCSIKERVLSSQGCPLCRTSTEAILNKFLIEIENPITKKHFDIKWSFRPTWCRGEVTNNILQFDFVVMDKMIIIELDGKQHFTDVEYFKKTRDTEVMNDVYKMKKAINNGYSIIRISQLDVRRDKNNWKQKLIDLINKCEAGKPTINYIDNENLYDYHKKMYENYCLQQVK